MVDISTKEKILKVAHKLFADKGYNGVSIREIAKLSEVNIAAINYHFSNKENLYTETIRASILSTQSDIENIYNTMASSGIDDFATAVFDHFMQKSEDLRTAFKLIISSDHFHDILEEGEVTFKGPPGGEFFAKSFKQSFPEAAEEDIEWAVRILLTQVIHKAILVCNSSICSTMQEMGLNPEKLRADILRLVKILKSELS